VDFVGPGMGIVRHAVHLGVCPLVGTVVRGTVVWTVGTAARGTVV
jgi:hypothetical protein